jgi:hypothetical protein
MTNKIFNAAFIVLIVMVGLAAAYILFEVLDSEASGQYQGYSVTGAAAGFVVVELLLFSTYQQLRKSDEEDLEEQIDQLQKKLMRGAPTPKHFDTEVAEREKIVLARPREWKPGAGIIFGFQHPREVSHTDYDLVPEFRCSYAPISEDIGTAKAKILWWQNRAARSKGSDYTRQFYENYRKERLDKGMQNFLYESYTCEYDYVGGEPEPIESLRVITHEYVEVIPQEPDPATEVKRPPRWRPITRQRYEELPKSTREAPDSLMDSILSKSPLRKKVTSGNVAARSERAPNLAENGQQDDIIPRAQIDSTDVAPNSRLTAGTKIVHSSLICYHEQLGKIYYFDFWATPGDFIQSSAKFNQILNSVRFLN